MKLEQPQLSEMDDVLIEVLRYGLEGLTQTGQSSARDWELLEIFTDESIRRGLRPLNYRDPKTVDRIKDALAEYDYRCTVAAGRVQ